MSQYVQLKSSVTFSGFNGVQNAEGKGGGEVFLFKFFIYLGLKMYTFDK